MYLFFVVAAQCSVVFPLLHISYQLIGFHVLTEYDDDDVAQGTFTGQLQPVGALLRVNVCTIHNDIAARLQCLTYALLALGSTAQLILAHNFPFVVAIQMMFGKHGFATARPTAQDDCHLCSPQALQIKYSRSRRESRQRKVCRFGVKSNPHLFRKQTIPVTVIDFSAGSIAHKKRFRKGRSRHGGGRCRGRRGSGSGSGSGMVRTTIFRHQLPQTGALSFSITIVVSSHKDFHGDLYFSHKFIESTCFV